MSCFGWLSYSESERRKALDVISLFSEQATRDELGIGVIRDALADLLFPGTSTIQRRAGYFLFVPWIYLKLEEKKVRSVEITERARREEIALIDALVESGETEGVIGIEARKMLKRLPSSVYWQGLARWGIRVYPGSIDQYHRSLDGFYLSSSRALRDDDGEPVGGVRSRNWHSGLPRRPGAFPQNATFRLTRAEAEYLRERVLANCPRTMLAFLLDEGKESDPVAFPWRHAQQADLSPQIKDQLAHARAFSEVIHGAALLYNLLLAKKKPAPDLMAEYEQALKTWGEGIRAEMPRLTKWDRGRFWDLILRDAQARVGTPTRQFVDAWLELAFNGDPQAASTDRRAEQLIREREHSLKRGQARLENQRALELWGGAAGTAQLDYRWNIVQTIVADIQAGLRAVPSNA